MPRVSAVTAGSRDTSELVTPEPNKKPRSSYIRFQAAQPNETWQADATHWRLADGTDIEIITWLDDHARYAVSVTAHLRITGRTVVDTFRATTQIYGIPFSTLTDIHGEWRSDRAVGVQLAA